MSDHLPLSRLQIGHDHGSPAVGNFVSHYPERVYGAGFLCVPYLPDGFELSALVPLVDRRIYPEKEFPLGQWDYHRYHYEHFDKSVAYMNGDPGKVVKMMFRAAGPQVIGKPAGFARVNKDGGWFGGRPLESGLLVGANSFLLVTCTSQSALFPPPQQSSRTFRSTLQF